MVDLGLLDPTDHIQVECLKVLLYGYFCKGV